MNTIIRRCLQPTSRLLSMRSMAPVVAVQFTPSCLFHSSFILQREQFNKDKVS
jgi:hypothetical protein